jgi:hypothetical protein
LHLVLEFMPGRCGTPEAERSARALSWAGVALAGILHKPFEADFHDCKTALAC